MNPWAFFDFLSERGENDIRQWINSLPKKAQVKIDYRILLLQSLEKWPEQYVSAFTGKQNDGIYELRIVADGVQYRPLGCYGPQRHECTLFIGTIEKGKLPQRVLNIAVERRKIILADRRRICEHTFSERAIDRKI